MLPFALIAAALLGWLWWTGRIGAAHIFPIALILLGGIGLAKGVMPMAVAGFGGAGYMLWKMGRDARTAPTRALADRRAAAEQLLSLPVHYDLAILDQAYRDAAKIAHPDAGGSADQIAALTAARDLLKTELAAQKQR